MKKFSIQAVFLILVILLGLAFYTSKIPLPPFFPNQQLPAKQVMINGNVLEVDIAETQDARNRGLGGRESLASNSGMLFVFSKADKYPFWMKGIRFPLDFIWIRNNTVVDYLESIQPPASDQSDQALTVYAPKVPVDKVLEVNSGTISRLNIKLGDKISVK